VFSKCFIEFFFSIPFSYFLIEVRSGIVSRVSIKVSFIYLCDFIDAWSCIPRILNYRPFLADGLMSYF